MATNVRTQIVIMACIDVISLYVNGNESRRAKEEVHVEFIYINYHAKPFAASKEG